MAVIWLAFLAFPVLEVFQRDLPLWSTVLTLTAIAVFACCYVAGFVADGSYATRILLGMATCMLVAVPALGIEVLGLTPFLGAFSAILVPSPTWKWTTPLIAALPVLSLLGEDFPPFFFVLVWPIIGGCVLIRVLTDAETRAMDTRSRLALTAERERVARDVHDVLGHSLTALSVKAELAARLVDADPEQAKAELASIQATARQALSEVRSTVGGLRAGNLAAEVDAAPRVLADAGIEARVVGAVADTDPRHRALLAWVLREAVTNVVRHSRASSVLIELGVAGITVSDDGDGYDGSEGNGIRGMRERVDAAGGTVRVLEAAPGTRVEVEVA